MTRCFTIAAGGLLVVSLHSTARAQDRSMVLEAPRSQTVTARQEPRQNLAKTIGVATLVGAGIGSAGAASWATFGEDGIVPAAAGVGAGLGALTGLVTVTITR